MSTSYPESISARLQLYFEIQLNKEQGQMKELRFCVQVVGMEPLKTLIVTWPEELNLKLYPDAFFCEK